MAGRRPKPKALKALAGNPGKRRLAPDEPDPVPGRPPAPPQLAGAARKEWDRLTGLLESEGRLSLADGPLVEKAAVAHARWLRMSRTAGSPKTPAIVKTMDGGLKAHPVFAMERAYAEQYRKCINDLGLSPGTRARVRTGQAPAPDAKAQRLARFFGPQLVKGHGATG